MSAKVKGITIELSADAKGIETALKNVNKEISSTSKQLSSINGSLKLDPGNVDILKQKMNTLGTAIDQTKRKLETLKQAQASVAAGMATGQNTQGQYDALTREISDTTAKLGQLQTAQQQTNAAFQNATSGVASFQAGLQTISNGAMQVAQRMSMISMAAGAALAGLTALGMESAQTADDLVTMAQQSGISVETLQELKYASEAIDVPLDTINGALRKMKGNINSNKDAFAEIGVSIEDQNGELRSTEDIFKACVKALGNIQNETQRDTAAMKIFGKSADELAGLIDDGGKKMAKLGQEAHNIGAIIPEDTINKLAAFNDKVGNLKIRFETAGMQLALPILQALEPLINNVANALNIFAAIASKIPAPIIQIAVVALALIAAIAPLAMGISGVAQALTFLTGVLPGVGVAFGQMANAMTAALASNPYAGIILAIVAALAILAVAVAGVIMHWDELKEGGRSALNDLKSAVAPVGDKFHELGEAAKSGLSQIPGVISKVVSSFSRLAQGAQAAVQRVVGVFQSLMSKAFSLGSDIMGAFTSGITSAINEVTSALQGLVNQVVSILNGAAFQAGLAGSAAGKSFASEFNSASSQISTPRVTSAGRTTASMGSNDGSVEALTTAVNELVSTVASNGTNVTVELVGSASNIFDTVRVENTKLQTATGYHALA